jgi:hypothetical protein
MPAFDGVYAENPEGFIAFHPVAPPSDKEMEVVTQHIARRIARLMKRLGFAVPGNCTEADAFQNKEPLLAEPLVIPSEAAVDATAPSICSHDKNKVSARKDSSCRSGIHPRRYTWAELLKRVF